MKQCHIEREARDGVDVLYVRGPLDTGAFPQLEAIVAELARCGRHRLVIECSELDFINSTALGGLLGFARAARPMGGDVKLAALPAKVSGIVAVLGFDQILDIGPDADVAVARFAGTR